MIDLPNSRKSPKIAVYLSVAGLVVQAFAAALIGIFRVQEGYPMGNLMGSRGMATAVILMGHLSNNALLLWAALTSIFLLSTVLSIMLLIGGSLRFVRLGSLLLIVLAMLSAITAFGLIVGSALMFAAGIAGVHWAYSHTTHL